MRKNTESMYYSGEENLEYPLVFAAFVETFKRLHIWFWYLKSTFTFKRTQWLNSFLDWTSHARCLCTLPLLGSLAVWFSSAVASRQLELFQMTTHTTLFLLPTVPENHECICCVKIKLFCLFTCNGILYLFKVYSIVVRHSDTLQSVPHPIFPVPSRHHTYILQYYWLCNPMSIL